MAALCCRAPECHKERERLLCSKITDYIRKQSNHKGHLRAYEWMSTEILLQFNTCGLFPRLLSPGPHSMTGKKLQSFVLHLETHTVLYSAWACGVHSKNVPCDQCVPFPTPLSPEATKRHCRLVLKLLKTLDMMGAAFVCKDQCMREMPGTFQHVLISANSPSEVPQLWWAGGWLSGMEQTHANIQTQTLMQPWMPSGLRRPLRRDRALREIRKGVGGHWSRRKTRKREQSKGLREKGKKVCEIADW